MVCSDDDDCILGIPEVFPPDIPCDDAGIDKLRLNWL